MPSEITGSDLDFSLRSVLLVEEPSGGPLEERGVRGERRATGFTRDWAENGPRWITGSDLCFSIRSVLLVEEPGGGPLGERGVRGERGVTGSARVFFRSASAIGPRVAFSDSRFPYKTNGKAYILGNKGRHKGRQCF